MDKLLTVDQAAEHLGTSTRFIRRLIAERRIAFNKLGRHVRLSTTDLDTFIQAGRVEPWSRQTFFATGVIHNGDG